MNTKRPSRSSKTEIITTNNNRTSNIQQAMNDENHSRNTKKTTCWSKYRRYTGVCSFLIFTLLCITAAVIIICLVLQKKINTKCQFNLKKTAKPATGYNSHPQHVQVVDINNDTHLDIMVANTGTDCIGIFFNNGIGIFQNQITYSTGERSSPLSLAHGHFNDDSTWDIVVANYGINNIAVLIGNRNGTFQSPIMTSLGASRPRTLAITDFNKDNHSDVAVVNDGTFTISILFGLSDGLFRMGFNLQMEYDSMPYSLVITDFNKDNQQDIIVVNYGTSNLIILLADGNGSFVRQTYSTGKQSHPCCVVVGDFNNDNTLDIAISNSAASNIGIFLGHNNGSVGSMIISSTGFASRPHYIMTHDFTNDTILDLVVIDRRNNAVLVLSGDGYGKFSMITNHSTGYQSDPSSLAFGDFDNDQIPDVVITNNATNNILLLTAYHLYPVLKPISYSLANHSHSFLSFVEVADLNKDNLTDLVILFVAESNVHILLNIANGTYQYERVSMTFTVTLVAINDVNNDKQLDLILVMPESRGIQILLGYGNGSFGNGHSHIIDESFFPESIAVKDLNNDHYLDIVTPNGYNHFYILYGYGNGSFTNITAYSMNETFSPTSLMVDDLNNDRVPDIIMCDSRREGIAVFLGSVNQSYTLLSIISTGDDHPNSLSLADLNNDHHLDIVYASDAISNVGILFGLANGTFTNITRYYTLPGSWPRSVTLGYMNNDAFLDIVVANSHDQSIGIFFGLQNGSFLPQTRLSTEIDPYIIRLDDFNNDKQLDVVVLNININTFGIYFMYYETDFKGETGYFTGSGPHPYSVAIGHFNRSNQSDIVVANSGNDNIQVFYSYDRAAFMNMATYSTGLGSQPQVVIVADFNRDNQSDIAVANNKNGKMNVFFGYKNGTFDTPSVHPIRVDAFPSSLAIGDLNEDNWMDLVVANYGTDTITVFLGFNYASFTGEIITIPGPSAIPLYVSVGDFNNDHRWDMVVANQNTKSVGVYLGHGNGSFATPVSAFTGIRPVSIAVGDLNNDLQMDLVIGNYEGQIISILIGYGNGSFRVEQLDSRRDLHSVQVAVGDLNHDNNLDIIFADYVKGSIDVFMGYGNGSFGKDITVSLLVESYPKSIVVIDLNNDHILDIAVANSLQSSIGILYGYGNGSFGNMITLSTGIRSGPYSLATADINNDGWIDIAVANSFAQNVGIFFGSENGTFSTQTTYSTGPESNLYKIILADLNSDGKADIAVGTLDIENGDVGIFYGYGNGQFTRLNVYPTGLDSDIRSIALCDFNNDTRLDVAILLYSKDSIGIMLQRQTEPFATPLMFPTGNDSHPKSVITGDFNHDYHLDIAVANSGTNNIGIFLGYGNGTFTSQKTFASGDQSEPVCLEVGHFNNDTHLDLVVANSKTDTISIFYGYGNGSFTLRANYSTGTRSTPSSIAVRDLNRDNYLDIVVANVGSNNILVFFGSTDGNFLESKSYSLGYQAHPQSVKIEDINNDSLYDIIMADSGSDYVEIFLQTC